MQLKLFGSFALLDGRAERVAVPSKRGRALLAYLALKRTRSENREALVDLLWPDRFKNQAQASLRQVLHELRKLPGSESPLVDATRTDVGLGEAIQACDVWAFETCSSKHGLAGAEQRLRLYRGAFLDGPLIGSEPFHQWAMIQRARLEGQLETAVLEATAACRGTLDGARAVELLERLVSASPLCCQAVLRLMEIAADRGRVGDAIRQYERYAARLKLELGEDPPVEMADAYATMKTSPSPNAGFTGSGRATAELRRDPWRKTDLDAPVLAVLPFRHEGEDPSGRALADALGEDILLMLSGCRWFSILSRSATHAVKLDHGFVAGEFARQTGADYLIYGSLSERRGRWSVVVELANAETGYIVWAKRFEADGDDILSWSSDVCPLIVSALDPAIAESEHLVLRKPALAATGSAVAYRHLVAGYRNFYGGNWPEAQARFRDAIAEDATYAHAHAMLAVATYLQAQVDRDEDWPAGLRVAEQSARRALEIDPSEGKACNILGQLLDWQGRHGEAIGYLDRALAINPSFAQSSTGKSFHAVMVGEFEAAKSYLQAAMRLRVGDAGLGLCLPAKALADLHLGNHRAALKTAHWAARLRPHFWLTRLVLAVCLSAEDKSADARDMVDGLKRDYGGLRSAEFAGWFPYADADMGRPIVAALQRAGWQ
jgi:DNA-binding SARP family transcriptional activator/TolB-like protein/Tfp pilus assembly protein PilF